jgi:hypothetical protein
MKSRSRTLLRRAIFLLVLCLSLYSLYTPSPPPHELLSTKNGWVNSILAKYAYAWTFLPSLPLIFIIRPIRIHQWIAGSLFWFFLTQWCFGYYLAISRQIDTLSFIEYTSQQAHALDPRPYSTNVQGETGRGSTSLATRSS